MSKYFIWIGVVAAAIAAIVFLAKPKSNLYCTSIENQAQVTRNGQTLYLLAGEPLFKGDTIVTTKGQTVLDFNTESSSITLPEGTTLLVDYDAANNSPKKLFHVLTGQAKFNIVKQDNEKSITVLTKACTVNTPGTQFAVSADKSSATVEVSRGSTTIINNSSNALYELPENYKSTISGSKFPAIESLGKVIIPKILNFTALNPETGTHIPEYFTMANGATLSLEKISPKGLDLRANTVNSAIISHVNFTLTSISGKIVSTVKDEQYPFTFTSGNPLKAIKSAPGTYILTADVFTPKSTNPVYSSKFKFTLK